MFRRSVILVVAAGFATLLAGCGRNTGSERVVVSGKVTYNGKPVADGMVYFVPPTTSALPASGAAIIDGKYKADGNGGVPVGMHKVRIEAYLSGSPSVPPGMPAPPPTSKNGPRQQYLPAKYNTKTQIEITIEPGSRQTTKNFELTDRN